MPLGQHAGLLHPLLTNADLPHELVVRPLSKTLETWQWSGSFNLGQRQVMAMLLLSNKGLHFA